MFSYTIMLFSVWTLNLYASFSVAEEQLLD